MCAVSAVHDYMRTQVPMESWTRPLFTEYQEIVRRLDGLDTKFSQPFCDDTSKADWMKEVEERLQKLGV